MSIALYLGVNFVCVCALGAVGLAATTVPATDVMRSALGETGARLIAAGIAISTLGFLSQSMLTAPRVYYAMAEDGLFPGHRAYPSAQPGPGTCHRTAGVVRCRDRIFGALRANPQLCRVGRFHFFGLSATCIFALRRHDFRAKSANTGYNVPEHPGTTLLFVAIGWLVVLNTMYQYPVNTAIGLTIMLAGVPVYYFWSPRRRS